MPPNKKGGKGYKKGKGDEVAQEFIDIQAGQYMARAIRILGDRNVLCYCDDNVLRICHICRKMKGRVWVEAGDMVLVSLRDFSAEDPKSIKRGDILAKYAPDQVRVLKKDGKVNERLFMKLEDRNGISIDAVGEDKTADMSILDKKEDDDGFDFESGSESGSESESEEEAGEDGKIVAKKDKKNHRGEREIRDSEQIEKEIALDDL
jgi:translation initiation factor 1A